MSETDTALLSCVAARTASQVRPPPRPLAFSPSAHRLQVSRLPALFRNLPPVIEFEARANVGIVSFISRFFAPLQRSSDSRATSSPLVKLQSSNSLFSFCSHFFETGPSSGSDHQCITASPVSCHRLLVNASDFPSHWLLLGNLDHSYILPSKGPR